MRNWSHAGEERPTGPQAAELGVSGGVGTADALERAAERITDSVDALLAIAATHPDDETVARLAVSDALTRICTALEHGERAGLSFAAVRDMIGPARSLFEQSPLWQPVFSDTPNPGITSEASDALWHGGLTAPPGSLASRLERSSCCEGIVVQFRTRVRWQIAQVRQLLERDLAAPRLLSICCGPCLHLRELLPDLDARGVAVVLSDRSPQALALAESHLAPLASRLTTIAGSPSTLVNGLRSLGHFDLILVGDLFDTSSDAQLEWVLPKLVASLDPNGVLGFSAVAHPDPHRVWMTYFANWRVLDRTNENLRSLLRRTRLLHLPHFVDRDTSGRVFLVTIRRGGSR